MSLTEFFVRRVQFTGVLFVALLVLGIQSLRTISRTEDPTFPIPTFLIVAVYPGASPTDLEQLVVDPIEARMRELEDVERTEASIEDGLAVVTVEFAINSDADRKYDQVSRELNALRPTLPSDLHRLAITRFNPANVNIVQLALASETAPYAELEAHARQLRDDLRSVSGVRTAETWAYPPRELRVAVDLGRLTALQIPLGQVLGAIQSESMNIPGGSVDIGQRKFNIKTSGSFRSLDEVRETIVASNGSAVVRLADVADVGWGYAEQAHYGRLNGERAVFVTANMKEGENITVVRERIEGVLQRFGERLPPSVTMSLGFDQSRNVARRLRQLGTDFGLAIALVLVTLLPLGLRASGIVMVAIPLSLAIGVALLKVAGFSINQLTIVGFVIALGLLVDDSIVVVENISRHLRQGYKRMEAAIAATRQITAAVLGYTATLTFAFVPLMLLPGGPGKFIRGMPVAVVFAVAASLIVSLTIVPFLASRFLRESSDERGNVFMRLLNRAIDATYTPVLHRALARPRLALGAAAALFVASLGLVPLLGFSLFPKAGTPQFLVTVDAPLGASLAATDSAVRIAERTLVGHPNVASVFANVGRGNPQIYYNVIPRSERTSVGELFVTLHNADPDATPRWLDSLRRVFDEYPAARINVKEFENGPPIDAPIALRITGDDLDTLSAVAARSESLLDATPGTRAVANPLRTLRQDLKLDINRAKAGLLGIATGDVDRTVRMAIAGLPVAVFRETDGDEHDITVRLARGERQTLAALDRVYVPSVRGALVPLKQVAALEFESSPAVIQHFDGERSVTVTADVRTGFNTDRVTKEVLAALEQWQLPDGVAIEAAGEIESRQESFGGLGTAIILATFGILTILILEFHTFRSMLIVASVIPLGVVGGLAALWLGGYTLSFTAMVGFVALVGIEIKNSILLVDFTNQLRAEGMPLDEAIERAGKVRFVPVVLTTLTAIGGLLPLALQGSSLYSPLASVIIGGLVSSTVLSRLVTPVMYKLLAPPLGHAARAVVSTVTLEPRLATSSV